MPRKISQVIALLGILILKIELEIVPMLYYNNSQDGLIQEEINDSGISIFIFYVYILSNELWISYNNDNVSRY